MLKHVDAVHERLRDAGGFVCAAARPQEHEQDRLLTRPRGVVQQRREPAAAFRGRLALERNLPVDVKVQLEEQVVEPRADQPRVREQGSPLLWVAVGGDEPVLDNRDERTPL